MKSNDSNNDYKIHTSKPRKVIEIVVFDKILFKSQSDVPNTICNNISVVHLIYQILTVIWVHIFLIYLI